MPTVSIIIPCYNEQRTIRALLTAIHAQTYPRASMEVIISDGMSTDHTRDAIQTFQKEYPDLRIHVIDNPERNIPAALNRAIDAAKGMFVVRMDAHSVPAPDYVARCVNGLEQNKGENVGGVWEIAPGGESWVARSIAIAASHRLGVGDASYRYTTQAQYVDTLPFGAFRRDYLLEIGKFDHSLLTNEDYELNTRIRHAGGRIWLDPKIRTTYFARDSFGKLIQQYWRYGYWKAKMLQRYPDTLRWRQALPPLFVLGILLGWVFALFSPVLKWIYVAIAGMYFTLLLLAGIHAATKNRDVTIAIGIPIAIALMHFSWGSAMLWSTASILRTRLRGNHK